jgi:hypothetical protein
VLAIGNGEDFDGAGIDGKIVRRRRHRPPDDRQNDQGRAGSST